MKLVDTDHMSKEDIEVILNSPIPYNNQNEMNMTERLFGTLTTEEVHLAACGSYAYWIASLMPEPPSEEQRVRMAKREVRRHLVGNPYEKAAVMIKETCKDRVVRRVDIIRACFQKGFEFETEEEVELAEKYRTIFRRDIGLQEGFVRGVTREGLAMLILRSRVREGTNDDEFVATQIYLVDRAVAATEFDSKGKLEKIVAVFDFGEFKASLAPSLNAVKMLLNALQDRYTERLKTLVIIDPPLWMRTTYGLVKPFLDPVTREKFIIAAGDKKKTSVMSEVVDPEHAMPFLLPTGKLIEPVDMERFLTVVPFYHLYDCNAK